MIQMRCLVFLAFAEFGIVAILVVVMYSRASHWSSGVSTGLPPPGPGVPFLEQSLEFFRFVNLSACL